MSELSPAPELTVLTGGAGWFGRAFLSALARPTDDHGPVARQGRVRVLAANAREVPAILQVFPEAAVHVGDVTDVDVLDALFRGAAGASVVHAAGVIHPVRATEFARVNHRGTLAVLAAASRARAGRFVHLSSNSPFGTNAFPGDAFRQHEPYRPYLGYGESKMHAEIEVRAAHERGDVPTVIIRPPWFYGPWQPERQTRSSRWWQRDVSLFLATAASGGRWPLSTTWSREWLWRSGIRRHPARRSGWPIATPTRWGRW